MKLKRKICFLLTIVMLLSQVTMVEAKAKADGPKVTALNAKSIEWQIGGVKTTEKKITTTFDGTDKVSAFNAVVKDGDRTLVEGVDYAVFFQTKDCSKKMVNTTEIKNAGVYAIVVSGMNGYDKKIAKQIMVKPYTVTNAVVTTALDGVDFGNDEAAITAVEAAPFGTLTEGVDYTVKFKANKKAGVTAKADITFIGNFAGKKTNVPYSIHKATSFGTYDIVFPNGWYYNYNAKKAATAPKFVVSKKAGKKTLKLKAKKDYTVKYYVVSANDGILLDDEVTAAELAGKTGAETMPAVGLGDAVIVRVNGADNNFAKEAELIKPVYALVDVAKQLKVTVSALNGVEEFSTTGADGAPMKNYKVMADGDATVEWKKPANAPFALTPANVAVDTANYVVTYKKNAIKKITQDVSVYNYSEAGVLTHVGCVAVTYDAEAK